MSKDKIYKLADEFEDYNERRVADLIISAPKGEVRAAKKLLRMALASSLGIKSFGEDPHLLYFVSSKEAKSSGVSSKFELYVTDEEMDKFNTELRRLSDEQGWTNPPAEIYHD
jgi:hypothetical protein